MTLKLRTGVSCADTEYGIALLDEDNGEYWELNPTGAQVLRSLLAGNTSEEAAQELSGACDVDAATAREDVQDLVEALDSSGLVER
ncbi:lasso peptide biosynthesis PqqD family chaperone [Streptomyces spiramyceticus]|uniref:lasso peptide biosynthesis PqqD family chaperone n=1 Tax=Streptomyces spiramyceticus TaxID=299717 RepID=UPI00237A9D2A|nr:lasso peptide biosynthesis PqqD family chaperone [Streptomyces spiramyceticus]